MTIRVSDSIQTRFGDTMRCRTNKFGAFFVFSIYRIPRTPTSLTWEIEETQIQTLLAAIEGLLKSQSKIPVLITDAAHIVLSSNAHKAGIISISFEKNNTLRINISINYMDFSIFVDAQDLLKTTQELNEFFFPKA